ncbi:MAG: hypothetical protein K6F34_01895 [Lachnospiraceae bacterium]|nr:hypothetical protein [Lachnospiraceae bacterium]
MADEYKLPASSYEELVKIIKAYGNAKTNNPVSLDDLVKSSGMNRTVLSKNNGFLMQIGLVTKGNKKSPTETCQKLAQAYNMNLHEQVETIWKTIIEQDDFITRMISVVNIKGKIPRMEYVNHILYAANCGNANTYRAGASAIIEILKQIRIINEHDGYLQMCDTGSSVEEVKEIKSDADIQIERDKAMQAKNQLYQTNVSFFIQQYTCESGQIAKIIIPEDASEDDLLGFRDMLNIALKRKFKIKEE